MVKELKGSRTRSICCGSADRRSLLTISVLSLLIRLPFALYCQLSQPSSPFSEVLSRDSSILLIESAIRTPYDARTPRPILFRIEYIRKRVICLISLWHIFFCLYNTFNTLHYSMSLFSTLQQFETLAITCSTSIQKPTKADKSRLSSNEAEIEVIFFRQTLDPPTNLVWMPVLVGKGDRSLTFNGESMISTVADAVYSSASAACIV